MNIMCHLNIKKVTSQNICTGTVMIKYN